jgi:hypothetical protein
MRQALSIIVVAALVTVVYQVITGPSETVAEAEAAATGTPIQNAVSIHGLHVALPEHMTSFPKELVPLP